MIASDLIRNAGVPNWATQTRTVSFKFLHELADEFDKARDPFKTECEASRSRAIGKLLRKLKSIQSELVRAQANEAAWKDQSERLDVELLRARKTIRRLKGQSRESEDLRVRLHSIGKIVSDYEDRDKEENVD